MADEVTTRTLENGARNLILRFTSLSDGTGETDVAKIDATSVSNGYRGVAPGVFLKVKRIDYIVKGGGVRVRWDATTDEDMALLSGEGWLDFSKTGFIKCPAIAGATGTIRFTTTGFMINSSYDVTISCIKGVPQV